MTNKSCNCIVCAKEFDPDDLKCVALSEINVTKFKICQECFDFSDPSNDYQQVKSIVGSYLEFINAKNWMKESKQILDSIKK